MEHLHHHRGAGGIADVGQGIHGFHQDVVPGVLLDEFHQGLCRKPGLVLAEDSDGQTHMVGLARLVEGHQGWVAGRELPQVVDGQQADLHDGILHGFEEEGNQGIVFPAPQDVQVALAAGQVRVGQQFLQDPGFLCGQQIEEGLDKAVAAQPGAEGLQERWAHLREGHQTQFDAIGQGLRSLITQADQLGRPRFHEFGNLGLIGGIARHLALQEQGEVLHDESIVQPLDRRPEGFQFRSRFSAVQGVGAVQAFRHLGYPGLEAVLDQPQEFRLRIAPAHVLGAALEL